MKYESQYYHSLPLISEGVVFLSFAMDNFLFTFSWVPQKIVACSLTSGRREPRGILKKKSYRKEILELSILSFFIISVTDEIRVCNLLLCRKRRVLLIDPSPLWYPHELLVWLVVVTFFYYFFIDRIDNSVVRRTLLLNHLYTFFLSTLTFGSSFWLFF